MANTNYFSGIVKILETPKTYFSDEQTQVIGFRTEISQKRKHSIISVVFWGNLGSEVKKFYKTNDYILIEGYTSIRSKKFLKSNLTNSKQVFITVVKVYPILLNSNRTSTKI
jgi:single-stranded DNA-binding protein